MRSELHPWPADAGERVLASLVATHVLATLLIATHVAALLLVRTRPASLSDTMRVGVMFVVAGFVVYGVLLWLTVCLGWRRDRVSWMPGRSWAVWLCRKRLLLTYFTLQVTLAGVVYIEKLFAAAASRVDHRGGWVGELLLALAVELSPWIAGWMFVFGTVFLFISRVPRSNSSHLSTR